MKNTNTIVDVQSDKSFIALHQKLQNFTPAAASLVKTASVDYVELSELPGTAYAWPEMKKFAMHTKEHAALSLIYAHDQQLPEHVTHTLNKAAALYNIALSEKPIEKTAALETSLNNDEYLLPKEGMCKVASVDDVELGVEFMKRNSKHMDVMTSAHANKVLYKKASELNVEIPTHIKQEAGMTMCKLANMVEWIETRAHVSKDPKFQEAFTKLATTITENSKDINSRETLLKVATTIAILDVEAGLSNDYHKGLASPMQSVFNSEKVAEETVYFGGKMIPLTDFMKVPVETYTDILGEDSLPEITDSTGQLDAPSLKEILTTIPADMQMALLASMPA